MRIKPRHRLKLLKRTYICWLSVFGVLWLSGLGLHALALGNNLATLRAVWIGTRSVKSLTEIDAQINEACQHISALNTLGAPLLLIGRHARWLPGFGPDIQTISSLIEIGASSIRAVDELRSIFSIVTTPAQKPSNLLAEISSNWTTVKPRLITARQILEQTSAELAALSNENLSQSIYAVLHEVTTAVTLSRTAVRLALTIDTALGLHETQTYLILIQNQDELRATGGFIGGVGRLTLAQGKVVEFSIRDSYEVDDLTRGPFPLPPIEMQRYMGIRLWLFRDSNWSPDFSIAAQTALDIYRLSHGAQITGIVAVDQTVIQYLLQALGSVEAPDHSGMVEAGNFTQFMRTAWGSPHQTSSSWIQKRKALMTALAPVLLERLLSLRGVNLLEAARALIRCLEERHLLIQSFVDNLAQPLHELNWDGSVQAAPGDFLMIIDTNIGYNRVNPYIQQSLDYEVDFSGSVTPLAKLSIHYQNTGNKVVPCRHDPSFVSRVYQDYMVQCYWDYWRILIPALSQLVSSPINNVDPAWLVTGTPVRGPAQVTRFSPELVELSGLLVIPTQQAAALELTYALPTTTLVRSDKSSLYRLHIQKQAGTAAMPVSISIKCPADQILTRASGAELVSQSSQIKIQTTLRTDLYYEFEFTAK